MKSKIKKILFFIFAILFVFSSTVFAQSGDPTDDEVNEIAKNMFCPVCENTPLDQCGTQACQQWRDEIREKLSQGWTEDEIYDYFVKKFGDSVLAIPPRRGFNWLVYVIPPLVIVVGGYFAWRAANKWRTPSLESQTIKEEKNGTDTSTEKYVDLLEEELKNRQ